MNIIAIMLTALNLAGLTGQGGLSDLANPAEIFDLASLAEADSAAPTTPAISSCLEPDFVLTASGYGDDDLFTGDKRLACEAILCLSTPSRPSECSSAIQRYYSIKRYHDGNFSASRTRSARKSFLALCPSNGDAYVQNLSNVLGNTLNQCDASYLNSRKVYYARAFDVLQGQWSNWKQLGKNNRDQGSRDRYTLNQTQFPACTTRQLNYAVNLAAGKETPPRRDPYTNTVIYPVPTSCYETRTETDPNPPSDCAQLFASDYTHYQGLKYESGTWVHRD